jgi:hypothetical protein
MYLRTATLAILSIGLAACTTAPINNVQDVPVATADGKTPSSSAVRGAIVQAATGLGWVVTDVRPGVIGGRLALRGHEAVVEIPYSEKSYSIQYKSSTNLNESDGNIHKNYNGWIQNLQREINAKVSAI